MKYTSAQAAKLLRKLNDEKSMLLSAENSGAVFCAALGEDIESVRPKYSFEETTAKLNEVEAKIRQLKHIINRFNLTTEIPGFSMTIDQALICIPQLSERKMKLWGLADRLPKQRTNIVSFGRGNNSVIDYEYANYDVDKVKAEYERISDELSRLQTALDLVNSTEEMEIDI